MSDRASLVEKLNDVHSFPCSYVFKVIGSNTPEFISRVVQAAVNVVGDPGNPSISTRESSRGNHLSVTLSVEVDDAETVLDIYEMLKSLEDVRFLL